MQAARLEYRLSTYIKGESYWGLTPAPSLKRLRPRELGPY